MNLEKISVLELEELFNKSKKHPKERAIKLFHDDNYEGPQVCLNIIQPESYIKPHFRYRDESLIHFSGKLCSIKFDNNGNPNDKIILTNEIPYMWLPKETYHTIISLEQDSAIWMIVQGPHNPNKFSEFLPNTPNENEDYLEYFKWLKSLAREHYIEENYKFPHGLPK